MHLLSLPTSVAIILLLLAGCTDVHLSGRHLLSLDIDGRAVRLWVEGADGTVQTKPLGNLLTVDTLRLRGTHDGRWLFLLKYAPHLSKLRCASPAWSASDDPVLPFESYNLHSLSLSHSDRVTEEHFMKLLTVPPDSRVIIPLVPQSIIRHLELVDIHSILSSPQLPNFLSLVASTIETLRLSSTDRKETDYISRVLCDVLPSLSILTHLNTTAQTLGTLPPSLRALTISLGSLGSVPEDAQSSDSPVDPGVGMIHATVIGILDLARGSSLKSLTITDAAIPDYLHFHLAGSRGYGDEQELGKQDRLWRQAAIQGVLITVANPAKDSGFEEQQVGSPFDPAVSIGEPDLTRSFPHLG